MPAVGQIITRPAARTPDHHRRPSVEASKQSMLLRLLETCESIICSTMRTRLNLRHPRLPRPLRRVPVEATGAGNATSKKPYLSQCAVPKAHITFHFCQILATSSSSTKLHTDPWRCSLQLQGRASTVNMGTAQHTSRLNTAYLSSLQRLESTYPLLHIKRRSATAASRSISQL